jgi:hypothetical protein
LERFLDVLDHGAPGTLLLERTRKADQEISETGSTPAVRSMGLRVRAVTSASRVAIASMTA